MDSDRKKLKPRISEIVAFGLFGFAFSFSLIAGWHIHIDESNDIYSGIDEVYLEPLTALDAIVLVVFTVLVGCGAFLLYRLITNRSSGAKPNMGPIPVKWVVLVAAILFVCWLPYLLIYWPGLIFSDSLSSISQALHQQDLNNHHPVLYTQFIHVCIIIGRLLGDRTLGIALYSIIQMAVIALCLSYLVSWVRTRMRVRIAWLVAMVVVFGLVPYYATYSVAVWKDPVFSCSLVILSLMMADLVFSHGAAIRKRSWLIALILCSLVAIFSRNNGVYIVALCCLACIVLSWKDRRLPDRKKNYIRASYTLGIIAIVTAIICGPGYRVLGISGSDKEAQGVLLGQMANVVVHDGSMSDSDRKFLDQMLPLEKYKEVYAPRFIDPLKTDGDFAGAGDGMMGHWLSMLVRNPDLYVEAWVLQTYGFWTVNRPEVLASDGNIMAGMPRNIEEERFHQVTDRGITPTNLFGGETLRDVFVLRCVQPSVGVILWVIIFLALCLGLSGRKRWLIALLPSLGLMATLLVATPLYYWPRYAWAIQLLIPLYMGLFALLSRRKEQ